MANFSWIYINIIRNVLPTNFQPTIDDIETLKEIRNDKDELKLFRVEAGFKYALLNFDIGNRMEAAEGYREAIRIGEKKNSSDDLAKVMEMKPTLSGRFHMAMTPMSAIATGIDKDCYDNLEQLTDKRGSDAFESLFQPPKMRSDGSIMPKDVKMFAFPDPSSTKLSEDDFQMLLEVGGNACDYCGKPDAKLSVCARCKMVFYCSKECQKKEWKLGHKKFCRKPSEYEEGDFATLNGLVSQPELNGTVVKVVGPTEVAGRWEVKIGEEGISIWTEKMRHMRPLDVLKKFRAK